MLNSGDSKESNLFLRKAANILFLNTVKVPNNMLHDAHLF